ncbi:copper-fist-domain-containing protein [Rhizopus microsporus var. microsporus]|uniref:Copper-fist-domain-containing protein n=1 Tax=Rhizopus microsporus var. microsporus TaxID=86635 RepID=A0A1X0QSQ7_RHIZD|nr:copper-fist-domain-containing protein [Rhizopus microsporus var. microsporus]
MYINGIKYACSTCIKGHRSSHCNHVDRPLFEIRKKGRPVTQCTYCRDLRKTKQVHIKCACNSKKGIYISVKKSKC